MKVTLRLPREGDKEVEDEVSQDRELVEVVREKTPYTRNAELIVASFEEAVQDGPGEKGAKVSQDVVAKGKVPKTVIRRCLVPNLNLVCDNNGVLRNLSHKFDTKTFKVPKDKLVLGIEPLSAMDVTQRPNGHQGCLPR